MDTHRLLFRISSTISVTLEKVTGSDESRPLHACNFRLWKQELLLHSAPLKGLSSAIAHTVICRELN